MQAEGAEDRLDNQLRIVDRSQGDQPDPIPEIARRSAAALSPSLVLPAPPLPVRVSSRVWVSRRLASLSSLRRPTKLVSSAGRLFGRALAGASAISAADYTQKHPPDRS